MSTTIVVPVFDEMHRIPDALGGLLSLASASAELIFVDDGSRDGTAQFLTEHARPGVSVLRLPCHRGKGAAVRAGMRRARGRALVFMDADLATDVTCLEGLLAALERAHVAIGSRSHPDSRLMDTTSRRSYLGSAFNRFTQSVTGIELSDTQCGFKAFRADVAKLLFNLSRINGFAFDVELLYLARALRFRVAEVPVSWTEKRGSKVRTVRDPVHMAADVLRTRARRVPRGAIAVCRVWSPTRDVEQMSRVVEPALRTGDLVASYDDHLDVVLPGLALPAAELVAARVRTLVPDAETAVAPARARQVVRELCGAWPTDHQGSPRVGLDVATLPA